MQLQDDDQTTRYRLGELERSFREFKQDWSVDVREMKMSIGNTQSAMGAGLTAIQTQLAAMQVRDEQTKDLNSRVTTVEKLCATSSDIGPRVKTMEDRAWLIVLSALGGFAALGLALFQIVIDHGAKP